MARGWRVWTALWIVYVVWGSTYLAIKVTVRTLPPLLSAGMRFVVAGLLLAMILGVRRTPLRVRWREAGAALGVGVALLSLGVGVVTLAETRIDSSVAAMIAGSVPLQVIIWRSLARDHVAAATKLSALVGLGGLLLIIVPSGVAGGSTAVGLALMLGASLAWSIGSFVSRGLPLPADPFVATAYEMVGGGAVLVLASLALGEGGDLARSSVSAESLAAWLYLVVAGSLVAFTAYAWLLRNAPISQVVTHQYVNPLVAIALGWLFLGETLDATTAAGAVIVIGAVFATVRSESRQTARAAAAIRGGGAAPGVRAK
jgi:drug/metabolite transporter (DMT)-like permease